MNLRDKFNNGPRLNVPDKQKKIFRGVIGGIIVVLLGAFGLELSQNDWNLNELWKTKSFEQSKVLRDKEGNIVQDRSLGKATDEYNCVDFDSRDQAQRFFVKAGGKNKDTNNLDGDNDGQACEQLVPAAQ